jgi:hypothetical protein
MFKLIYDFIQSIHILKFKIYFRVKFNKKDNINYKLNFGSCLENLWH